MSEREVELLSYLPQYVQDYTEIQEIMQSSEPRLQSIEDAASELKDNQFIKTCDVTGISRYEDMLGMVPDVDDSLDNRIARVLIKWNDSLPYTWKKLLEKLDALCGTGNYEASRDLDSHTVSIVSHMDKVSVIEELLDYMLPCNLGIKIDNSVDCNAFGLARLTGGVSFAQSFYITDQED